MQKTAFITLLATSLMLAGCAKSPESTVESFYKAVAKGEISEAQSYLSAQVGSLLGPQKVAGALAEESERVKKCGGIKSIDVKLEGQGEIRSGAVTVAYAGDCSPKNERVKLVKEDGKWKIGPNK